MPAILLAVDGSEGALRATRKLIDSLPLYRQSVNVDLLTVHLPVHHFPRMGLVISEHMLRKYYDEECEANLRSSKALLDASAVKYEAHALVGPIAETIVEQAKARHADFIYLGKHGGGVLPTMLLGSTVTKVLHMTTVPVVVVP